jgi:hypothetical protein
VTLKELSQLYYLNREIEMDQPAGIAPVTHGNGICRAYNSEQVKSIR